MVFNDRPTYKDRHARNSSWPGELISIKGRIHLRRLVFSPLSFPLQSCGGPYIPVTNLDNFLEARVWIPSLFPTLSEMYLIAGASRVTGHGSSQADPDRTPAAPRDIPSTWVFLLPGTAQTSLRRLGPVPPEFDALFVAARTWDTLTSVSLLLP